MTLERGAETFLEDHPEGDVDAEEEGDRRRERVLALLLRREGALPVEVEPRELRRALARDA